MKRMFVVVTGGLLFVMALVLFPFLFLRRVPSVPHVTGTVTGTATVTDAVTPFVSATATVFPRRSYVLPVTPSATAFVRAISWRLMPDDGVLLSMAAVVEGEAAPEWDEGYLLVAWTLREWAWNGRLLLLADGSCCAGWHGKKPPSERALRALRRVWLAMVSSNPYPYCYHLGNDKDTAHWQREGWYDYPAQLRVVSPYGTALNCYTTPETNP